MTPHEARVLFLEVLREVAPDADLDAVAHGADVRHACGLDAPRFRRVMDRLGRRTGLRLHHDDADADCLLTLEQAVPFLLNELARRELLDLRFA